MHWLVIIALGFAVGILVGMMGIGGGIIVVPALVYLVGMDQHTAQGTSLLVVLPPLGLGALLVYLKKGQVDTRAGILCAIGLFLGGYFGGTVAIGLASQRLTSLFGIFLMLCAVLLWRQRQEDAGGDHG
jgi:uncharacterized membrane protein YfcA